MEGGISEAEHAGPVESAGCDEGVTDEPEDVVEVEARVDCRGDLHQPLLAFQHLLAFSEQEAVPQCYADLAAEGKQRSEREARYGPGGEMVVRERDADQLAARIESQRR